MPRGRIAERQKRPTDCCLKTTTPGGREGSVSKRKIDFFAPENFSKLKMLLTKARSARHVLT